MTSTINFDSSGVQSVEGHPQTPAGRYEISGGTVEAAVWPRYPSFEVRDPYSCPTCRFGLPNNDAIPEGEEPYLTCPEGHQATRTAFIMAWWVIIDHGLHLMRNAELAGAVLGQESPAWRQSIRAHPTMRQTRV